MRSRKLLAKRAPLGHGRGAERFPTQLPVDIGGMAGLTRNISATGIYYEAPVAQALGSHVHLSVELTVRGRKTRQACEGDVVRVECAGDRAGMAAKLAQSFFADEAEVIEFCPRGRSSRKIRSNQRRANNGL